MLPVWLHASDTTRPPPLLRCVQKHRIGSSELGQVCVVLHLSAVAHVTAVNISAAIRELEQEHNSSGTVVCIYQSHLNTCTGWMMHECGSSKSNGPIPVAAVLTL